MNYLVNIREDSSIDRAEYHLVFPAFYNYIYFERPWSPLSTHHSRIRQSAQDLTLKRHKSTGVGVVTSPTTLNKKKRRRKNENNKFLKIFKLNNNKKITHLYSTFTFSLDIFLFKNYFLIMNEFYFGIFSFFLYVHYLGSIRAFKKYWNKNFINIKFYFFLD